MCSLFFSLSFVSCGGITVKGANGTEYESYQECCAAQDFEAAHQYLAKMQNSGADGYSTAKEYVFKQEALYLMSQGDEQAQKRITYLLKEEGGNDEHVSMLIDLAIENDDEDFVKTLANQYKKKANRETLEKVAEFLLKKDQDENMSFLKPLLQRMDSQDILMDYGLKHGDMNLVKEIAKEGIDFQNTNVIAKLASLKDNSLSDAIIQGLSKRVIPGSPLTKGLHDFYDISGDHSRYKKGVIDFNNDCKVVLDIAITSGNRYLAKKVLNCFRQNIEDMTGRSSYESVGDRLITRGEKAPDGTEVDGNHSYVWYSNTDKNEAQKRYNEAVKSGAFN